jgi:hypothetical protein
MSPLAPLSPEALERMTDVYRRAVHELKLDGAPKKERDRLAVYIFAIGSVDDPHRMLDRAVRMYHRAATVHDLPEVWNTPKNAESNFEVIVALATHCRFRNCRHESEPACAVNAVGLGEMDASHVADYLKIASPRRRRQPRV